MLRSLLRASPGTVAASSRAVATGTSTGPWRKLFSSTTTGAISNYGASHYRATLLRQAPRVGPTSAARGRTLGDTRRGFRFSAWRRNNANGQPQESLSLGQRLKKLSREYGWAAVGVYFALSIVDFPICFLVVRAVGTETIGRLEHSVVSGIKSVVPDPIRRQLKEWWLALKGVETKQLGDDDITDAVEMAGWGVREAQEQNKEEPSLATQLALAYAIHKSFIFFRVPLTAAVTPRIVKVLRSWGWKIGKPKSR